jgi:hypothetical protein
MPPTEISTLAETLFAEFFAEPDTEEECDRLARTESGGMVTIGSMELPDGGEARLDMQAGSDKFTLTPPATLCSRARAVKTTKPANTNCCSSATVDPLRSGSSSRQATPSARYPSLLSPSKTFAARAPAASSSGRSSGVPGSSYWTASLMTSSGAPLVISRRRPSCCRHATADPISSAISLRTTGERR